MSDEPKYRDGDWLREQYVEKKWSTHDIAEECDCANSTVRKWMDKYDISRRGYGSQGRGYGPQSEFEKLRDEEWVRECYVEKGWSTYDIAEECDCANSTVRKWMDEYNISRRPSEAGRPVKFERLWDEKWLREQYVEGGKTTEDMANICGCTDVAVYDSLQRYGIETERPVTDERLRDLDWVKEQYLERERSGVDIAQGVGCSATAVYRWLRKHGLETQNHYNGPTGSDHPSWEGGPAPYGPGWNKSKRQSVRNRDDHTCQDPTCSVTQADHLDEYGQKLHVHHLRKARDIEDPEQRNAEENLITLCVDCHMRWEKIADAGLVPEVSV